MSLHNAGVIAGTLSTVLFVASYLPMLVKAARTRDLTSYSVSSLAMANLGNAVHTIYVVSLPPGPIWALHGFYLACTALMTWWYLRYRDRSDSREHQLPRALRQSPDRPADSAAQSRLWCPNEPS